MCHIHCGHRPVHEVRRDTQAGFFERWLGKATDWLHQTIFGSELVKPVNPKTSTWVAMITQR